MCWVLGKPRKTLMEGTHRKVSRRCQDTDFGRAAVQGAPGGAEGDRGALCSADRGTVALM